MKIDEELDKYLFDVCNRIINAEDDKCLGDDIDENLKKKLCTFPIKGKSLADLCDEIINDIVPYCTDFHNPSFLGFPDSGNSAAGIIGGVTSELLQQNLINSTFCSPIATHIEIAVINWFRRILGFEYNDNINSVEDIGGIITTGGTLSNTIAMLLARINRNPNSYINGVSQENVLDVVVPESIGHYSIGASLCWTGCGNRIIEVPIHGYKYDLEALEKTIKEKKNSIMSVIIYAGDSRTMTIDKIETIYNMVKGIDEKIWVHVDACNGFCLAFSENLKNKLAGIELCDSVSIDPHKMLMVPYTASILLVKKPKLLTLLRTKSDLIMNDDLSLGQITPFIGSKAWISLKIWCVLKKYGLKGLSDLIEKRYLVAQYLKQKIELNESLLLLNDVDAFSVVFMYVPAEISVNKSVDIINAINKEIHERLLLKKKWFLHQFPFMSRIEGDELLLTPLRFFSGNSLLDNEMIEDMLIELCGLGDEIYEKGLYRK